MKISLLISSLPTQNTTTRMRVWRSLKASGAATLRDGVYVLPIAHREKFDAIANDVISEQGTAYIFHTESLSNLDLSSMFSRKEEYDALYKQLTALRDHLTQNQKKELLKQVRKLRKSIDALVEIDYYPDETQAQVLNELSLLERAIARLGEVNEPQAIQTHIQLLDKTD